VRIEAQRSASLKTLTSPLEVRLKQMETDFIKGDRVPDAKLVREYRESLSSRDSSPDQLTVAGGTAKKPPAPIIPAVTGIKDGFTNTLGMKFLPVKGIEVMFCIHETRRQDYAVYTAAVPGVDGAWMNQQKDGIPCGDKDDHPVVGVSWGEAQAFCAWLSKKEGRSYRLPTDEEWSWAVGIGRDEKRPEGITPEFLSGKQTAGFPWGGDYPPKTRDKAGNYTDMAWKEKFPSQKYIEGYNDGFPTTAPVMSFKPNKLGLYDMGGNVCEWVADWWNAAQKDRVMRGASFRSDLSTRLSSSYREHVPPTLRIYDYGFRLVMELK